MKKTLAVILSVIMLIACVSVSVSASVGVDEYTSSYDIIAPNAENVSVTTYDADGFVLDKYEKLIDEKTGDEIIIFYGFNDDGELIPMSKDITAEDEDGRLLSAKNYEYDSKTDDFILTSETKVTYDGLKAHYDSVSYDADGNILGKGYIDDENDEQGRNIYSHMVSADADGNIIYDATYEYSYSEDGNTILSKTTVKNGSDAPEITYNKAETITDGSTVTEILYESEDGKTYTPFNKIVTVKDGALKETVTEYGYEDGKWEFMNENSYEYDREDRDSLWASDSYEGKALHRFSADGKKGEHIISYLDEQSGKYLECEKSEETFIDSYRRSLIRQFYKDGEEWEDSVEFTFEYDDENSSYKVSAYIVNADGTKTLSQYAVVKYRLIEKPADENPETGDLVSIAASLMSLAAIGGTTLITRKKVK